MMQFLVELYVSRTGAVAVEHATERVRVAAQEQSRRGEPVRYLRAIFVPEEETCFLLLESDAPETVRDVLRLAALPCEHVATAIETL